MKHRYQVHLLVLASLAFVSCDESPTGTGSQEAPALLASWGAYYWDHQEQMPGDMALAPGDERLYVVQLLNATPSIRVIDRPGGEQSIWTLGARLSDHPTRIAVTPAGQVCILFGDARRIAVYSPERELLASWVVPRLNDGYFQSLYDLAVDPGTSDLLVTDGTGPRFLRYSLAGALLAEHRPAELGQQYAIPFEIGCLSNGDILIYKIGDGGPILFRYRPNGDQLGGRFLASSLPFGHQMAIGRGDEVYVDEGRGGRVVQFDLEGRQVAELGSRPGESPVVQEVGGFAVTADGSLLLGDIGFAAVYEFTPQANRVRSLYLIEPPADAVVTPTDLVVGPGGALYSIDRSLRRVQTGTTDAGFTASWGSPIQSETPLRTPVSVAVTPDGIIYVSDPENERLRAYAHDGTLRHEEPRAFWEALAADREWLYAQVDNQINRRPVDQGPGAEWVPFAYLPTQVRSMDVARNGYVYVLTGYFGSGPLVVILDPTGKEVRRWKVDTTTPGAAPWDIAVDGKGRVYVTDANLNLITVYHGTGHQLAQWQAVTWGNLYAIDVDDEGFIYVGVNKVSYQKFAPLD